MYKINLTDTEKLELQSKVKKSSNPWLTKRYQTILMRNDELSTSQIANYVSADINTIRESKLEPFLDRIESYIETNEVVSIKQLGYWLLKEHQVDIDESWLRKWCKKKDLAIKKAV